MKSIPNLKLSLKKMSPRVVQGVSFAMAASLLSFAQSSPQTHLNQVNLPEVRLDAAGLTPRPIEELTGTTIARHYALAWRDLSAALESGQAEGVSEEFVGFAKDRLLKRIAEQNQAGMRVHIVDHGHHLKAVFYSADGSAMQLLDQAQLEIQTFDGNKLLDTQSAPHEYMVLMTPGADRWYVRDLEEVSDKPF